MAKIPLKKIRITGLQNHYKILMQELHKKGVLQIVENQEFKDKSKGEVNKYFGVFDLARIDFVLKFLGEYEKPKSKISSMLTGGKIICSEQEAKTRLKNFSPKSEDIIEECEKLEESLVKTQNELKQLPRKEKLAQGVVGLESELRENFSTSDTKTWISKISSKKVDNFISEVAQESNLVDIKILSKDDKNAFFRITTLNKYKEKIEEIMRKFGIDQIDFKNELEEFFGKTPTEILSIINSRKIDLEAKIEKIEKRAEELSKYQDDFRILYDYNSWRKTKNDLQYKIFRSERLFAFEAWIDKKKVKDLEKWIKNVFVGEVVLEKISKEKDEKEPVLLKNTTGISSFEAVVEMFSLPGTKDTDPTIFVAFFFTLFFGFCLSDVGYGLLLSSVAAVFMIFGKFTKEVRQILLLLLVCGLAAIGGGIVFGGYFGMEPSYAPKFLLNAEGGFRGQLISPTEEPIKLLSIALALGAFQLLAGIFINFCVLLKRKNYIKAFADPGAWFVFFLSLFAFGLADKIGINKNLALNILLVCTAILILTQGRDQKNWIMKILMGVYGIYDGLTGFLSNFLSYARLMALAIATGVVAMVMNTIAGMVYAMMPNAVIGVIVAVLIILFGHALNFVLSLLGAFIHTARLQFIEFFGKFYEGGGDKFTPFARVKKYILFRD